MLFRILSLILIFSSCDKSQGEQQDGTFNVSVTELKVSHEQAVSDVVVEADADWAVYAEDKTWITCSPEYGMAGTYTVEVKVSANKDIEERSSTLVFRSGSRRIYIPVVQSGNPETVKDHEPEDKEEEKEEEDKDDDIQVNIPDPDFVPEGYTLFWSDEFDGTSLNTANWTCEIGRGSNGWGNSELQYYTDRPENVTVRDGKLVITARKENYNGAPATSARLITLEKVFFKYGYIVASIKLPKTANGLWPAFWMMGNDFRAKGWPNCGETDILEMGHQNGIKAGTQEKYLNGACHWGQPGHAYYGPSVTNSYSVQDGQFHTFTCIWDENQIAMYVDLDTRPDAKPYFKMALKDFGDNEFRKDNFLLLNLAVGGNFPGIWDINQVTALKDGPAEMEVDFIRVFQK